MGEIRGFLCGKYPKVNVLAIDSHGRHPLSTFRFMNAFEHGTGVFVSPAVGNVLSVGHSSKISPSIVPLGMVDVVRIVSRRSLIYPSVKEFGFTGGRITRCIPLGTMWVPSELGKFWKEVGIYKHHFRIGQNEKGWLFDLHDLF